MDCNLKNGGTFKFNGKFFVNIFDVHTQKTLATISDENELYAEYMGRLFSSLENILEEIYAYRIIEYAKEFNRVIDLDKSVILAEKLASEKVKNFDNIINYVVTGK